MFWNKFKPSVEKITVSILMTVVWFFIIKFVKGIVLCDCIPGFQNCKDYYSFLLIKECHCSCIPIQEVLLQYFWFLIFPFIVIYILYSFIRK